MHRPIKRKNHEITLSIWNDGGQRVFCQPGRRTQATERVVGFGHQRNADFSSPLGKIIIGKGGKALKRVGTQARREIEAFFGKPVFLQLFVKVDKDWRSSQTRLRHYGYDLN